MKPSRTVDDLVVVRTYDYRHEAEVGRSVLEAHSVPSVISADDSGAMGPWLGRSTGGVRLLVRHADRVKAKELLG